MLIPVENVKHPLQNDWSFWLFTNEKKKWEDNLMELTTFNTVEDYWCLYHHMKVPTELRQGQDYLVFKMGIKPMWEHAANKSGGRWLILLEGMKAVHTDAIWSDTVLLLIGANFQHYDEICGVVVNIRGKNKISIWMRTNHAKPVLEVGKKLREKIRIPCKMNYFKHNASSSMYSI